MTDEVKKLIQEHGEDIFPYLVLRSRHKAGNTVTVDKGLISEANLRTLNISGYIGNINSDSDLLEIEIAEGNRWLYQPVTYASKKRPVKVYRNATLEKLADLVGYPIDWINKQQKYIYLFFKIRKKYSEEILLEVAKYASENHKEVGLDGLLTETWFKSLKSNMENPNKGPKEVIGREAESEYTEGQTF